MNRESDPERSPRLSRLSSRRQLAVATTLHYGLIKPDWTPYPGTSALGRKTFHPAISEILPSWDVAILGKVRRRSSHHTSSRLAVMSKDPSDV